MAIDTHAKRRAALHHLHAWRPADAVLADGTTSAVDRAAQLAIYTFTPTAAAVEPRPQRARYREHSRGV